MLPSECEAVRMGLLHKMQISAGNWGFLIIIFLDLMKNPMDFLLRKEMIVLTKTALKNKP